MPLRLSGEMDPAARRHPFVNQYRIVRGATVAAAALFLVAGAAFASQMALGPRTDQQADPTLGASIAESAEASPEASEAEPSESPEQEHVNRIEDLIQGASPSTRSEDEATNDQGDESAASPGASASSSEDEQEHETTDDHGEDGTSASASPSAADDHGDEGGGQRGTHD